MVEWKESTEERPTSNEWEDKNLEEEKIFWLKAWN